MNKNDVVLTGLPRSGTSFTCYLLNKVPNTVALVEPIRTRRIKHLPDEEAVADEIEQFFRRMRRMARRQGMVMSKQVDGRFPDNALGDVRSADGSRQKVTSIGKIPVGKPLKRNFLLVIKSPNMFTSVLPALARRMTCYATVRNPLSVLASGLSSIPSERLYERLHKKSHEKRLEGMRRHGATLGQIPLAKYDESLMNLLEDAEDGLEVRIRQLHWRFDRFARLLPPEHIIRYEDVISSGGKALEVITPAAAELDEPLESKNLNKLYDRDVMRMAGERLLQSEGACWDFYSRESVEELMEQLTH